MAQDTNKKLSEVKQERDLLEKRLHAMHRRYDEQRRRVDWIFAHPLKFLLKLMQQRFIKRDQKYEKD